MLTLCNARVLLETLREDIELLEGALIRGANVQENESSVVNAHRSLARLIDQFDASMRGVQMALDQGGGRLPIGRYQSA